MALFCNNSENVAVCVGLWVIGVLSIIALIIIIFLLIYFWWLGKPSLDSRYRAKQSMNGKRQAKTGLNNRNDYKSLDSEEMAPLTDVRSDLQEETLEEEKDNSDNTELTETEESLKTLREESTSSSGELPDKARSEPQLTHKLDALMKSAKADTTQSNPSKKENKELRLDFFERMSPSKEANNNTEYKTNELKSI